MWLGYVGGSWVIVANLTLIIILKPVLNGARTFIVLFCSQKSVLLLGFLSFPVRFFHFFLRRVRLRPCSCVDVEGVVRSRKQRGCRPLVVAEGTEPQVKRLLSLKLGE